MLSRRLRAAAALATLGAVALSGCYVYVAADAQAIAAGESVRVRLARGAAAELAEVAPDGQTVVRGTLVGGDREQLFLRVPVATRREGFATRAIAQELRIGRDDILEVELRRRSAARTAAFVAGTGAVAAAVIGLIVVGGRDRVIRDDAPPDELRVPLGF